MRISDWSSDVCSSDLNLQGLPLTVLEPLQAQIRQTQQLIQQAQRMAYDVQTIEREFGRQYKDVDLSGSQRTMVAGAEGRWRISVAAFGAAMKAQAGVVGHLGGSRRALTQLVTASQTAPRAR